jgi:hypothetical protein
LNRRNVSVTLNGAVASLVYTGAQQINLRIPPALSGQTAAQMVVSVDGASSAPFAVHLVAAAPASFTPGVPNQDNSVNSTANAAPMLIRARVSGFTGSHHGHLGYSEGTACQGWLTPGQLRAVAGGSLEWGVDRIPGTFPRAGLAGGICRNRTKSEMTIRGFQPHDATRKHENRIYISEIAAMQGWTVRLLTVVFAYSHETPAFNPFGCLCPCAKE